MLGHMEQKTHKKTVVS